MRNRIITLLILVLCVSAGVFAAVPAVNHYDESYFKSPGRLADVESSVPFGISLESGSDIKALEFLASPASAMQSSADALSAFLSEQSDEYLSDNYSAIASIFSFDSAFPVKDSDAGLNGWNIREYLASRYSSMDAANRSKAVENAISSGLGIFNGTKDYLGGDLDISLAMYSEFISNGLGWSVRMTMGFDSQDSWLTSYPFRNNDLYLNVSSSFGYSLPIVEDRLYAGFSITPRALFVLPISNYSLVSTRTSAEILSAFTGNIYFGFGAGLNLGLYYKASDALAFAVDYRNVPSIDTYWYLRPEEVLGGIDFHRDNELYVNLPDVAFTVINDFGAFHMETEISDFIPELINSTVEERAFRWSYIPKLYLSYDVTSSLAVNAGYEAEKLSFGVRTGGFTASVSTKLTELYVGIKVGYEF